MKELEIKRETTIYLNQLSASVISISNGIDRLYSRNISNVAEIYRDKMLEYEKILKGHNLSFYNNNILGQVLLAYFDSILLESAETLRIMSQNISDLPKSYIFSQFILLLNSKYITDYEKTCSKLKEFSLQDKLVECVYNFFDSRKFYAYYPGWFYSNYSDLKDILIELGFDLNGIDDVVSPVIQSQEDQILYIYEFARMETGSSEEDVIRDFINNLVDDVKERTNGMQKHI